jgi:uncharacterized membrane protein YfcA
LLGSRAHVKIKEEYVKKGFITILIVAAIWMIVKIYLK